MVPYSTSLFLGTYQQRAVGSHNVCKKNKKVENIRLCIVPYGVLSKEETVPVRQPTESVSVGQSVSIMVAIVFIIFWSQSRTSILPPTANDTSPCMFTPSYNQPPFCLLHIFCLPLNLPSYRNFYVLSIFWITFTFSPHILPTPFPQGALHVWMGERQVIGSTNIAGIKQ